MGARRIITSKPVRKKASKIPRPLWFGRRLVGSVVLLGVLGSLVGSSIWWLSQPDTLPIQRVQVEGEFRYLNREDLYAVVGDLASGGFFNIDVRAVKEAAESLPWVDTASVRRQWPDTLRIDIDEQQPLAHWGENQMLNARGEIFAPPMMGLSLPLPQLNGPADISRLVAARYELLSRELAAAGLSISKLHLSERRAWQVQLGNSIKLVLGRSVNDVQLRHFVAAYQQGLADQAAQMEVVDLRYSNGFAVRWKDADGAKDNSTGAKI